MCRLAYISIQNTKATELSAARKSDGILINNRVLRLLSRYLGTLCSQIIQLHLCLQKTGENDLVTSKHVYIYFSKRYLFKQTIKKYYLKKTCIFIIFQQVHYA